MKFIFLFGSALCMMLPLEGSPSLSEISANAEKALLTSSKQSNPSAAAASGSGSLHSNTIASPSEAIPVPKRKSLFEDAASEQGSDDTDIAPWAITPIQREILLEREDAGLDTTSNEAIQSMRDEARKRYEDLNLAGARPLIPKSNLRAPESEEGASELKSPMLLEKLRQAQEKTEALKKVVEAGPATQEQKDKLAAALVDEFRALSDFHDAQMKEFPPLKAEFDGLTDGKKRRIRLKKSIKDRRAAMTLDEKKKREALIAQRIANQN